MPDQVTLRDYIDARFREVEAKVDSLGHLVRRELELLSEDRERQRHDLSERLDGMNALRDEFTDKTAALSQQLDRFAGTFATRERLEALERATWRAIGVVAGLVLLVQILASVLLRKM